MEAAEVTRLNLHVFVPVMLMFDGQAFESWYHIVLGALCFAVLFGAAVAMGEALFDGSLRVTRSVVGLGGGAFLGYIGVAMLVRYEGAGGRAD